MRLVMIIIGCWSILISSFTTWRTVWKRWNGHHSVPDQTPLEALHSESWKLEFSFYRYPGYTGHIRSKTCMMSWWVLCILLIRSQKSPLLGLPAPWGAGPKLKMLFWTPCKSCGMSDGKKGPLVIMIIRMAELEGLRPMRWPTMLAFLGVFFFVCFFILGLPGHRWVSLSSL